MLAPQSGRAQTAEVCAELGCWSTTIQTICGRVRAGVAAVHHDFGGNQELYAAMLDLAVPGANQAPVGHPPDHLACGMVGRPA